MMSPMKQIENLIWKNNQYDINNGNIVLSKSKTAWFIRIQKKPLNSIDKFIKNLPANVGYYITYKGEYMLAPIETEQERYDFAEIKASITGEMLVEKKKEVLEIMKKWKDDLEELATAKKALEIA